jgi:diadenosine tetraphosphate (Ap4A) HIT family hydrolase
VATIFTRIIQGEIPGTFVWRDEECVAFMSINPLAHGHTLVVPIAEIDHWVDAPPGLAAHLFEVTHRVAQAQREAFTPERVGVIIAGYEVPHAHIHVVPTSSMAQLDFSNAQANVDRAELEAAANALRALLGTDPQGHPVLGTV